MTIPALSERPIAILFAIESPDVLEVLLAFRVSAEVDPCFVLLPSPGHLALPSIPAVLDGHINRGSPMRIRNIAGGYLGPIRSSRGITTR